MVMITREGKEEKVLPSLKSVAMVNEHNTKAVRERERKTRTKQLKKTRQEKLLLERNTASSTAAASHDELISS